MLYNLNFIKITFYNLNITNLCMSRIFSKVSMYFGVVQVQKSFMKTRN